MQTATIADAGVRVPELAPPELAPEPQLPAVVRELKRIDSPAPARVYPAKIAKAILAVTKEIGRITKDGRNTFQNYNYVKWEDVCEKLSPLLADHDLIMVQNEKSRHLIEDNDKGSTLSIVYGFSFVDGDGNTWPEVEWTALARLRDQKGITDDKAAAKCHTQAEKYFCIKQFKIRTADAIDSDADGRQHDTLPKKDARATYAKLETEIHNADSVDELRRWREDAAERIAILPPDCKDNLWLRYKERLAELQQPSSEAVREDDSERSATVPAPSLKQGGIAETALEVRYAQAARSNQLRSGPNRAFLASEAGKLKHPMNDELPEHSAPPKIDTSERDGIPGFLRRDREPSFVDLVIAE